jgi:BASS family bile acid:Na+ symporter
MVMMTISCLKIDFKELKNVNKDWWRYLIILINIFFVSSLIVYLTRNFIDQNFYLGLLITLTVPCGISVVFLSLLLGGEPTKALVTTTLAHLLAPMLTPFLVWLFARQIIEVNFIAMFILILKLIIIPLILAQIIKLFKFENKIEKSIGLLNTLLLFLLNWGTVAPVANFIISNLKSLISPAIWVFIFVILQIAFGIWFGRTNQEDVTWTVTSFSRNTALAIVICITSFGTLASLGVVVYMIISNAILGPLQFWATRRQTHTILNP